MDQNLNSDKTFIIRKVVYVLAYKAIISYPLRKITGRKNCVYNVKLLTFHIHHFSFQNLYERHT